MRIVKGNKIIEISLPDFLALVSQYNRCCIDIGTGDGRFIYENALRDPDTLYIGLDPAQNQLKEYSAKVNRKKLKNALFVVGSAELLPTEFTRIADKVFIVLPWGSLLELVVKPTPAFVESLKTVLKDSGSIRIIFGYSPELEPAQIRRLDLQKIDLDYLKTVLVSGYKQNGLLTDKVELLTGERLAEFKTTWAKALSLTNERPLFELQFRKD